MKYAKMTILLMIILSFALAGCASKSEQSSETNFPVTTASGDIHDMTKSMTEMPHFLSDKPEEMVNLYMAVAKHQKLLEKIPCYCGCGESANHLNNYDCFINQNKNNGSVVWDDHGTKCNVCLETASTAISEYQNGKSIMDIRNLIDDTYKEGYAKPTPTPKP